MLHQKQFTYLQLRKKNIAHNEHRRSFSYIIPLLLLVLLLFSIKIIIFN